MLDFIPCNKEKNNDFYPDLLRVEIQERIQSDVTLFYSFLHHISVFPSCIIPFLVFLSKMISNFSYGMLSGLSSSLVAHA